VYGLPEPQTAALHNAAERGHEAVVRLLLEHDADIEAKNPLGTTALHDAADYGYAEALKTLLNGATLNGNGKAVRLLLENNADIETRNNLGARALDWCRRSWNTELRLMLKTGRAIQLYIELA
jgi:hypothetical protein